MGWGGVLLGSVETGEEEDGKAPKAQAWLAVLAGCSLSPQSEELKQGPSEAQYQR